MGGGGGVVVVQDTLHLMYHPANTFQEKLHLSQSILHLFRHRHQVIIIEIAIKCTGATAAVTINKAKLYHHPAGR